MPTTVFHAGMTLIEELQQRRKRLPAVPMRRAVREAAGVSQARMARELRVHRITLIRWENGTCEPKDEAAERYARLLADLERLAQ
jgi:DNA-binding XRE family transcriptional regulator